MAEGYSAHVGAISGLAAGILIVALTVMALCAFQPRQGTTTSADVAAVSSAN